ncbi:MAG TPA: AAA family ATPase [Bosea sp. (in: a-proteobacteria)]|uniref:AAA family ATPase n=1 Tax=Bosea sp. (in: a-proteobacteria) TaxID=1871050 RepID=UPI002E140E34|nr:AAA family ATPase [Bosea sp. (in: a-proteobacteria)]
MSHHGAGRSSKAEPHDRLFVISGCSGGGKSTLLEALARKGVATVAEPGRRIVREELAGDGAALPWRDPAAFARRALAMAIADRQQALSVGGLVVFDRSIVDAAAALERATGEPSLATLAGAYLYASTVFLAPPWPELHVTDSERPHSFTEAEREYDHLVTAYGGLGYDIVLLPRLSVEERIAFLLGELAARG